MKYDQYKIFSHYNISELKVGDIIQLMLKKKFLKNKSYSVHIKIIKISTDKTLRVKGEGICSTKGEIIFLDSHIYRNYSLDPIEGEELNHKRRKFPLFERTPTRKSQ